MNISLIAAMAADQVIGLKNNVPWILSSDLAWFRRNTLNKPVIMGRITYESIGKPLPQRLNIILSHTYSNNNNDKAIIWVNSINDALVAAGEAAEIMIIGGGKIYELFLPIANRFYLTHIDLKVIGDTYFPAYKSNSLDSVFTEYHKKDKKIFYSHFFEILERR